jgi:hypothetical protein
MTATIIPEDGEIKPGQLWKDSDPRSPTRTVEVTEVSDHAVYYTYNNRCCVSSRMRFVKAFSRIN